MGDKGRKFARRRLCLGIDADRRQEVQPVGIRQIAEGIMRSYHGAAVFRERSEPIRGAGMKGAQLCNVGRRVRLVGIGIAGIRRGHRSGDVLDIDDAVGQRVPGMGIDFAIDENRLDAGGCHNHACIAAGVIDQSVRPGLETEAIHEHDVRAGHGFGVCRVRLVEMRVGIGPDYCGDVRQIAGHLPDHVAEN